LDISASLVQVDYSFFGFQVRFPIFIDYFKRTLNRPFQMLSDEIQLHSVEFSLDFSEIIDSHTDIAISRTGRANGLLIKSTTTLTTGVKLADCISYCQPVIIPMQDKEVTAGCTASLSLAYEIGEGFDNLRCDLEA